MKTEVSTSGRGESWLLPDLSVPFTEGPGRSELDWNDYRRLVTAVVEIASAHGWSKAETASRVGMAGGTFSQWASKKYEGRYDTNNRVVARWLDAVQDANAIEAAIPKAPSFILTQFSKEVIDTFVAAQIMSTMVLVTAGAGVGKTMTSEHYVATHANAYLVTMSEHAKTYSAMLAEMADQLDIGVNGQSRDHAKSIGRKLKRESGGTLLIVDECQHLNNDAINELRIFCDRYKCGIALVGNSETSSRYQGDWANKPHFGQLHRRIFKRVRRPLPVQADIDTILAAWAIDDPQMRAFLTGIAHKPGSFGQVNYTLSLALMSKDADQPLTLEGLKRAWRNRGVE